MSLTAKDFDENFEEYLPDLELEARFSTATSISWEGTKCR